MDPVLNPFSGAPVRLAADYSPTYTEMLITPGGWTRSMLIGILSCFAAGHRVAETIRG